MKHREYDTDRPHSAIHQYSKRLVGMMVDYNISLREAIYWDFDGFAIASDFSKYHPMNRLFEMYFMINGLKHKEFEYYLDVALKTRPDYKLKHQEED